MVNKLNFITKCNTVLSHYFTEKGAKATIDVMERIRLKDFNGHNEIPADVAETCIEALYERVRMLKGDETAKRFFKEVKG